MKAVAVPFRSRPRTRAESEDENEHNDDPLSPAAYPRASDAFQLRNQVGRGLLCAVLKLRAFAKYWLPVVVWAAIIFSASGDKKSVQHSSRIIEPVLRWLIPDISDEAVRDTVLVVRKGAHVTVYSVLALLLWRGIRGTVWQDLRGWSRRVAWSAWLGAVLFAISDEFHQSYVPGRQGSAWDVMIDAIGAAGGLWALWFVGRWRKKFNRSQGNSDAPT